MLDRGSIINLVQNSPPLLAGFPSLDQQLQPNGFELTLCQVARLTSAGYMGNGLDQRGLSDTQLLEFDGPGWMHLAAGSYLITFNEVVHLPLDLMALGRPRSSLLRSGVSIHTAVWDAGYQGRSQALLSVYNPEGYQVQKDARLLQLVFFRLEQPLNQGYQGRFLEENIKLPG